MPPRQAVHRLRKLDVALRHTAGIVGGKGHLDPVVHVEPFRMVVELLGHECRAGHEPEGFIEVLEREFLSDGIAALDLAPALELGESRSAGIAAQFFSHGSHLAGRHCVTKRRTPATRNGGCSA